MFVFFFLFIEQKQLYHALLVFMQHNHLGEGIIVVGVVYHEVLQKFRTNTLVVFWGF